MDLTTVTIELTPEEVAYVRENWGHLEDSHSPPHTVRAKAHAALPEPPPEIKVGQVWQVHNEVRVVTRVTRSEVTYFAVRHRMEITHPLGKVQRYIVTEGWELMYGG